MGSSMVAVMKDVCVGGYMVTGDMVWFLGFSYERRGMSW